VGVARVDAVEAVRRMSKAGLFRLRVPEVNRARAAPATTQMLVNASPNAGGKVWPGGHGVAHYDGRSDRAFTSSLSCRTISVVLRMSGSLSATPMVEAIARNRAFSSR
jgi:hypothetical protein